MSELKSRPGISRTLLWTLVAFTLTFYTFFAFDFLAHPFAAGANATVGTPYLFRWLSFVTGTFSVAIAVFVMVRVRGNIVGPLLLFYAVGAVGWSGQLEWASLAQAEWFTAIFGLYFNILALPALIAMLFYFPTGHAYPPRLERWLPSFFICLGIFGLFTSLAPAQQSGVPNPLYIPLFEPVAKLVSWAYPLALLAAIATVVMRYRRSELRERMQLKWVVWLGAIVIGVSLLSGSIPEGAASNVLIVKLAGILRVIVFILWQGFAAAAFGIAILRHKLWDIDILIRRTLVYSALTATLALVYFGGVVVLQELFQAITGQHQSPIATVISTLGIAALFTPLRRRIQRDIDQRFYRKKYDAQKTLESFAARACDEVELEQLTAHLVSVVQETMQPEQVSLWLKGTSGEHPPSKFTSTPERTP